MQNIIKKDLAHLKAIPNLLDYEKTYREFNWNDYLNKIFLSDSKINAGRAIIENKSEVTKNKIAIFWERENGEQVKFTFKELSILSNKFANILKNFGIKKGDRVFTFLPRIPETFYCFLGILKVGAIAGNFFPAFGRQALFDRLANSGAKILITNKELSKRVNEIKKDLPELKKILLVDDDLPKLMENAGDLFSETPMDLKDPAFMLYTSATGDTPICGIVTPQVSLIQHYVTAKSVLDLKENDIYWCTADPGWVTGTFYGIIAPLMLGTTQVVFEGRFDPEKWYSLIEKYKITVWYTAPTAIRMLEADEEIEKKHDLSSLRHIASVGEALCPSSINWALKNYGLPIHDTYWQTETGGIMIANFPILDIKPGSMGKPIPGVTAAIIDDKGNKLTDQTEGNLAFEKGWPGMLIDVWKNRKVYDRYFLNNWFLTGDRAIRDKDGYFWFVGRTNEVIKTSGERIGPFEVESAIARFPKVIESAVIGKPDSLRGSIIKAFIVLKPDVEKTEALKEEIKKFVKEELAGHAYPREIEFVEKLPKNKSGKIVRRILKAKDQGLPMGDVSTLEEE